ncbi:MAG: hypothetical protein ACK5TU_08430 [Cyclobacteriaceae bacterium]|jgi:hypothetical protein
MKITLFQTLEDRNNPEEVEEKGPFIARAATAWLGTGYYFWDTHIELGHWWGKTVYGGEYIICRAFGDLDNTCFDLHGNGVHRLDFMEACNQIVKSKLSTMDRLLVPHVLTYIKKTTSFPYKAIRALAMVSIMRNSENSYVVVTMRYRAGNKAFFDIKPPVQVCLIEKKALSLTNYRVVYPENYVDYQYF